MDDVTSTTGATFSSCPTPAGYTAGPIDANGCRTFTPNGTVITTVTTCQVICNNGKCDTTYIIIDPPITPDTNKVTPACPTCPVNTCVVADDLTLGGQTYTTCGIPNGYTAVGPDANGCMTYTPNGPNTTPDTTCIVACKNGKCDTTYIIINPPVTPDSVTVQPTCPTCPVKACVIADDLSSLTGATFTSCGLSSTDATKGQLVLDLQGCLIWVGNGSQGQTDTIKSCVVACKNGVCDTTYVNILPAVPPYGPDSIYTTPTCSTCPTPSVCVTGDDIPVAATNLTYTSCGLTPADATMGSLSFNSTTGCVVWTPNPTQNDTVKTCVIICGQVTVSTVTTTVCDTTYMFFPPPPKPDTITKTPACPTCTIVACPTADNITITTATTFSTCSSPAGYSAIGPDAAGCMIYTPTSINTAPVTTCVVACNGAICDTTYVIINPPITPDTNIIQPACPTCPVNTCVQADDLTGGATGATFSTCPLPPGFTAVGPDVNGCVTYTGPSVPNTTPVTTCIVACKNGKCDTTYIIILPPITPDTVSVTPTCATCPVQACVIGDDISGGLSGATYSTCPPPPGFTTVGPDANGCVTYTGPSTPNTVPVTTCIVACKNGVCDTTYVIINPPGENKLNPDFNTTYVNVPVSGNINTNDIIVAPGSTYGTPTPVPGNPSACTPTIAANGTYTFVCNTPGEYNYLVPVCPPGVTVDCPTELLTITVLDPNNPQNPPTADPDYGTTKQDTPITIDVKANDKCNNGPTCTLSPPTVIDSANNGTVVVNPDGTIKYTPDPGFVGKDTLMYAVCDNQSPVSKCDTEYVFIDVLPTNAPNSTTAMDDYNKGGMGEAVNGNVKTNDTDPEADNQSVTPQNITIPGKGTFVLNPDGSYVFTPVDTFKGPIDIPYTICDDGTPQACSNATLHILIAQPDVTPNITATPNIMHSTTTFNVTVKVTELNMVKTNGTITVRIPKDNRLSFTYNPAAIKIGFTNVSNSVWNYNGTNPFFHIFTTTTVIPKGGFSTFGFVATFAPGNTDGKYTMTSTISSGSGSENRTNNNTDAESLDYFHN